ncbi:DUF4173 domain-containing protein [Sphingomonas sp. IC-56]|uniref:DUF4153 domain-containing protein n=1 Tax=Sphingomonas sp. IC-56 TaxID=2898529 RepID=UPI001E55A58A|nr:DUF4173 domain-containing protein [Sphingomonas sp. IC-56]MCD2323000.1 DUF4173 domain-containing protein [Sphingomonas sp. IC-56]
MGVRFSFWVKMLALVAAIVAADLLVGEVGSWLGAAMLAWAVTLGLVRPAVRRSPGVWALAAAGGFALVLAYDPGPLAWVMFWAALSMAALMPRVGAFDDAWRWALRLAAHGASGPFAPLLDLGRLTRLRGRGRPMRLVTTLVLPLAMTALFVALFASANPLIERALQGLTLPSAGRIVLWGFVVVLVWPSLRPRAFATRIVGALPRIAVTLPGASSASVLVSLALFNLVFAVQNGLDLAFLWSGAPLPDGMTLAEYAHRGAYPLIVTALLAGIFVLGTLKPGSSTAENPLIRRLVVVWIAQNLLLVASSVLRTCDYIELYMLTAWRIAALVWMGLVALGLVLICWRMLTGKSAAWLINANALAATLVLSTGTIVDLDAVAARWNVRHAREVGGKAVPLDLCQMRRMGSAALVPLIQLESRPLTPEFRARVRAVRQDILPNLERQQADWHSWTMRGHQRLAQVRSLIGPAPARSAPQPAGASRGCDGAVVLPQPAPAPLTAGARQ